VGIDIHQADSLRRSTMRERAANPCFSLCDVYAPWLSCIASFGDVGRVAAMRLPDERYSRDSRTILPAHRSPLTAHRSPRSVRCAHDHYTGTLPWLSPRASSPSDIRAHSARTLACSRFQKKRRSGCRACGYLTLFTGCQGTLARTLTHKACKEETKKGKFHEASA